jgi:hypothetical protein
VAPPLVTRSTARANHFPGADERAARGADQSSRSAHLAGAVVVGEAAAALWVLPLLALALTFAVRCVVVVAREACHPWLIASVAAESAVVRRPAPPKSGASQQHTGCELTWVPLSGGLKRSLFLASVNRNQRARFTR